MCRERGRRLRIELAEEEPSGGTFITHYASRHDEGVIRLGFALPICKALALDHPANTVSGFWTGKYRYSKVRHHSCKAGHVDQNGNI